jgi:branched-chain amino acid transport system permease protein
MADVEVRQAASGPKRNRAIPRSGSLTAAAIVVVGLLLPFAVPSGYWLGLFALAWVYALGAESVNLISGYLGELPLSTQAMFAIGAYASALIFQNDGTKSFLAIVIAAVGCGVAGAVLAPIVCRVTGTYFSVMTLAIAGVIEILLGNLSITGGANGVSVPPPSLPFGNPPYTLSSPRSYYYVGLIALVIVGLLVTWLLRSRWGRGAIAIRDNPSLAVSVGVNAFRVRAVMFAASCAIAGLGGALYAHYVLYISDDLGGVYYLILFLIMSVFGGMGRRYSPVIGALFFTIVPQLVSASEGAQELIFALVLLVVVIALPDGVASLADGVIGPFRRFARSRLSWLPAVRR